MKKVLISDIHFGSNQNSVLFGNMQLNFFRKLAVYLKSEGITHIDFLGDLFHHKELTDNLIKNHVYDLFKYELSDFQIRLLVGNHDIYYRDSLETNSLHIFEDMPNVTVIKELTIITEDNAVQAYFPWVIDHDKFITDFNGLSANKVNTVHGHFEMQGFPLNRLHSAKHGGTMGEMDLSSISRVFSGHYHTPSCKHIGDCTWQYLGSPFQHTRIDSGDVKGFVVFDTETLEYEFVESENILKFVTIEVTKDSELPDESEIRGNVVDVSVNANDMKTMWFEKRIELLKAMKPVSLDNKPIPTSLIGVDDDATKMDLENVKIRTIVDLIGEYVDLNEPVESDAEAVMAIMLELYGEASESMLAESGDE